MMFERTSKTLRVFCGKDIALFLETIGKSFYDCCERIRNNGGSIRIVSQVSNKDKKDTHSKLSEFAKKIRSEFQGIDLQGKVTEADEDTNHYIVCDSKMLRIEDLHKPLTKDTLANNIKAKVYFDNPGLAKDYEDFYDSNYGYAK